jgi:hypothetical protein
MVQHLSMLPSRLSHPADASGFQVMRCEGHMFCGMFILYIQLGMRCAHTQRGTDLRAQKHRAATGLQRRDCHEPARGERSRPGLLLSLASFPTHELRWAAPRTRTQATAVGVLMQMLQVRYNENTRVKRDLH